MTVGPIFFAPNEAPGGGGGTTWFRIVTWTGAGGASRTISTIDLSDGGMVWVKRRDAVDHHAMYFKESSGATVYTTSTSGGTRGTSTATLDASGFTVPHDVSGATYVAFVFQNSAGNFNVFSWTGNGVTGRAVPHGLGGVPKFLFTAPMTGTNFNYVQSTSTGGTASLPLSGSGALNTSVQQWNDTAMDATNLTLGSSTLVNGNGVLFFGFALGGADVAQGTYPGNGTGQNVDLGLDPQFLLTKSHSTTAWFTSDTTRTPGPWTGNDAHFSPHVSNAETTSQNYLAPHSGGFNLTGSVQNAGSQTYLYLAIR